MESLYPLGSDLIFSNSSNAFRKIYVGDSSNKHFRGFCLEKAKETESWTGGSRLVLIWLIFWQTASYNWCNPWERLQVRTFESEKFDSQSFLHNDEIRGRLPVKEILPKVNQQAGRQHMLGDIEPLGRA